jgi:methanogenic corrinoid protein MtbC1
MDRTTTADSHAHAPACPASAEADCDPLPGRSDRCDGAALPESIVPRLVGALKARLREPHAAAPRGRLGRPDVDAMLDLAIHDDDEACARFAASLAGEGIGPDRLCLDLFAPVARRLGELWDHDRVDFGTVTLAMGRLQRIARSLSPDTPCACADVGALLLGNVPGADHTFGPAMLADHFRRAGWDVRFDPSASADDLIDAVRLRRFDVVGLSLGIDAHAPALGALIRALRERTRRPRPAVMVGGPAPAARPERVAALGADFGAFDARHALALATAHLRTARAMEDGRRASALPFSAMRASGCG